MRFEPIRIHVDLMAEPMFLSIKPAPFVARVFIVDHSSFSTYFIVNELARIRCTCFFERVLPLTFPKRLFPLAKIDVPVFVSALANSFANISFETSTVDLTIVNMQALAVHHILAPLTFVFWVICEGHCSETLPLTFEKATNVYWTWWVEEFAFAMS